MNPILRDGHNAFHILYILGFLFATSLALPLYTNSSFLNEWAQPLFGILSAEQVVGLLYTGSSIITLLALIFIPSILSRFGNFRTSSLLIIIEIALLLGLAFSQSFLLIAPIFILYNALLSIIFFNFDVFLENYTSDEYTGSVRGIFLTMLNVAILISPAIAGFILDDGGYWQIYSLGAFFMFIVLVLLSSHFNDFKDPEYARVPFWSTLSHIWERPNLFYIFVSNMLLRLFFAWMVIYLPIYLHEHIGFAWSQIGIIFTISLLPFVLFEIPAGKLADNKLGEKELLTAGFVLSGISTAALIFIEQPIFWLWAAALFTTRIGASLIEITTESYFFKQVAREDANIMGFFRNNRPIAYIIGPTIATAVLAFADFKFLFLTLGIIMLTGIYFSLRLVDTK